MTGNNLDRIAKDIGRHPIIIAHRGASGVAPENTMAAFSKAVEFGSDLIEIDVHMTRDGEVVVIHDDVVDRTAQGAFTGPVADLNLVDVQSLDAGGWKGVQFENERVPTLEEALTETKGDAVFLVEVKARGIEQQIADIIERTDTAERVVIQSFHHETVARCRQLIPNVPGGVLFAHPGTTDEAKWGGLFVKAALGANASFVAIHHLTAQPDVVRFVKRRGLSVFTWTVNEESDMNRVRAAGVDAIITDYPERLAALFEK